ncbi:hypothetical protein RND81_13G136100 [Saponaria officinalis]|uniref:PB1 domain-containing protein n=1 Tax=Saponaria officinalis TaxID=3572 RepID=A0AAW1H285_SAPOF
MSSPPKTFSSTATTTTSTVKILCSYGGKILPRPSDGHLRYVGGLTRVVSVPRCLSFSELSEKLQELCGYAVALRCQLPTEDLDVLVTVKSDEDLANVIEEYDKASKIAGKEMKIRAILSPPKSLSTTSSSSPASPVSSSSSSPDISPSAADRRRWSHRKPPMAAAMHRNIPRRVYQYKVVGDCYHNYYPCHMQANPRPRSSPYLSPQHSNLWH